MFTGRFTSTFITYWQICHKKNLADLLPRLTVWLSGLAILLTGLADLLSKYLKI